MIRVQLPYHLQNLAGTNREVRLPLQEPVTLGHVLDALEENYPPLRGTIRDHTTGKRRPFIRYFACKDDLSHEPVDYRLPKEVVSGDEPLLIVGAMAGG